jgi:hypothetical protein
LSKEWLIDFNPKKTECIIFSTNQAANKHCIVFNNENVKFVENHKHLGVTFSHNCKEYNNDVSSANSLEKL